MELQHPASPRTFRYHHADPGQSASPGVFLVRKTHWNTPSVKAVRTLARTKHLHRTIEIVGVVIVEPAHIRNF